jgi:hypothetical protein
MKSLSHSMLSEGCVWSILFAQENARSVYAGLGWQSQPSRYFAGFLSNSVVQTSDQITVRTYDPLKAPSGWEPIAQVYHSYNASRPLTQIRETPYWNGYIHWMYSDWQQHHHAKILVAERKNGTANVCGYALLHLYDQEYAKTNFKSPPWFYISELGVLGNDPEAILSLLTAIAKEAKENGLGYGQMALPNELWIIQALELVFITPIENIKNEGTTMMKTLSLNMESNLVASKTAAEAFVWEIDRF